MDFPWFREQSTRSFAEKLQEIYCLRPLPVSTSISASKKAPAASKSRANVARIPANVARIPIAAPMLTACSHGSIAA